MANNRRAGRIRSPRSEARVFAHALHAHALTLTWARAPPSPARDAFGADYAQFAAGCMAVAAAFLALAALSRYYCWVVSGLAPLDSARLWR